MRFTDRAQAGEALAGALAGHLSDVPTDVVVLGIPRGGVIVAAAVARSLGVPIDVVVPRKLGAPGNPELGIGAIAPGVQVLDERMIARLAVGQQYVDEEIARQQSEIERREHRYRGGHGPLPVADKTVVLVDDGVATGGTAIASIRWARTSGAVRVVFAAPVAPPPAVRRLADEADEVVILAAPRAFGSVGEWYDLFDQTTDEEVVAALAGSP
ncbi:MAG: phosphoribosyltransferase family protein [Actinomycetota bacterium]